MNAFKIRVNSFSGMYTDVVFDGADLINTFNTFGRAYLFSVDDLKNILIETETVSAAEFDKLMKSSAIKSRNKFAEYCAYFIMYVKKSGKDPESYHVEA